MITSTIIIIIKIMSIVDIVIGVIVINYLIADIKTISIKVLYT